MALPSSGAISLSQVNTELGVASTTTRSLNDSAVRTLFGVASGAISMSNGYGKSNGVAISYTFSSSTANASLNVSTIAGYVAGKSNITITVNSGVYLYATSTGNYGLTLSGGAAGDTITLVNNGFIMGQGGYGGGQSADGSTTTPAQSGGPALNLGFTTSINNQSGYIGGGGGGGCGKICGGGGGAGGGNGGRAYYNGVVAGGAGGGIGAYGGVGPSASAASGGGGGRIMPGARTAGVFCAAGASTYVRGTGGSAGGSGGSTGGTSGYGGEGGVTGGNGSSDGGKVSEGSGGGGGWGASGGQASYVDENYNIVLNGPVGAGGKAVNLNGNGVTWVGGFNSSRVFGAVS